MDQENVQKLRKRIGWNQSQMARALGIAQAHTISHWETGFRVPKGISARFLRFLSALPQEDLLKITKHLEKLGMKEKPRARK